MFNVWSRFYQLKFIDQYIMNKEQHPYLEYIEMKVSLVEAKHN